MSGRKASYDPWADVGRRQGVELRWHAGDVAQFENPVGVADFLELCISLRVGQNEIQLRSSLTHELIHLERGPARPDEEAKEEDRVELLAAQRLIAPSAFDALMDSTKGKPSYARIQAELRVDWGAFTAYRDWRAKVQAATAQSVWRRQSGLPAWPPEWLKNPKPYHVTAARFAGVAVPANAGEPTQLRATSTSVASRT